MRRKPEILAPAGDMEKLQMAVLYGADAEKSVSNLLYERDCSTL